MQATSGMTQRQPHVSPAEAQAGLVAERGRLHSRPTAPTRSPSTSVPADSFDAAGVTPKDCTRNNLSTSLAQVRAPGQRSAVRHAASLKDRARYAPSALATYETLKTAVLFVPRLIAHCVMACVGAVYDYLDPKLVCTEADIVLSTRHNSTREKRANYERYLGAMMMPSVWGGELEIAAFGDLTLTPFSMYDLQDVDPCVFLRKIELNANQEHAEHPRLSLVRMGEHYQVVRHGESLGQRTDFAGARFINMPGDGNCLFYALAYLSDQPRARALIEAYAQAHAEAADESGPVVVSEDLIRIGQTQRESIVNHIAAHANDYIERLDLVVVNALADR